MFDRRVTAGIRAVEMDIILNSPSDIMVQVIVMEEKHINKTLSYKLTQQGNRRKPISANQYSDMHMGKTSMYFWLTAPNSNRVTVRDRNHNSSTKQIYT